ncbi:MAG: hypothetical protein AAF547_01480 [Actinomycetota bacterium]
MGDPYRTEPQTLDDDQLAAFQATLVGRLREIYGANPWVTATEVVQGSTNLGSAIRTLVPDAPVLAVGGRTGVGPVAEEMETLDLEAEDAGSMVANMHAAQRALVTPTAAQQAVVDRFDPGGLARVVVGLTMVDEETMGRRTFGARSASWRELEDKLAIEAVWAEAGIRTAPSEQVDLADPDAVLGAHRRLATGSGTVWAGDNRSGWHGGGDGTRWVPDEAAAGRLIDELQARFDRVRIMPFVEGVPCSIHGMAVPDGAGGREVVVFRPCEMMVLRNAAEHRFVYSRVGTYWDPDPADRAEMRSAAGRIGEVLIRRVGFRGVFTVDGVLGADGFVPTEVNPRYGAALPSVHETAAGDKLDLFLLNLAIVEGVLDDLDLPPLDSFVVPALDARRTGRGLLFTEDAPSEPHRAVVRGVAGALVVESPPAAGVDDEPADPPDHLAEVVWEANGDAGGLMLVTMAEHRPDLIGRHLAPIVVELFRRLDEYWSIGLPPLEAAREVRPAGST